MARRIAIVIALMMMTAAGFAQLPSSGNVYLGYSLNHANSGWGSAGNLNGWEMSLEGKIAPYAGMVADVGTQYGTLQIPTANLFGGSGSTPATSRVVTYMFGPRVSFPVGRFRPFAQALVGAGHLHQNALEYAYGETCLSDAIGGGVDYRVLPHVAVRAQGDALQTRFRGSRQTNERVSAGVVLKF